jgi:hypothetical protein
MAVLPKRFARYGLSTHPEKARIVTFTEPEGTGGAPTTAEPFVFCYYGITGDGRSPASMLDEAKRVWHQRSARRGSRFNREQGSRLLARYPSPPVGVVHSIYAANL